MNFRTVWQNIYTIIQRFMGVMDSTYNMIVSNTLLLVFVLVFAIFVGLALLKRLIHIK